MESVVSRVTNRIELRVVHSISTSLDAWMTVDNEGHDISFPVRTQLGMSIPVITERDTLSLRQGKMFVFESRHAPKSGRAEKKKPSYGVVHYRAGVDVDAEGVEQFHVKLYLPTERYDRLWELGSRGLLPRLIALRVKGLQDDGAWDVSNVGPMLLVEEYSFSFPIDVHGMYGPA
jgi:hypothetical protein